jgi:hypothetical protein
MSVIMKRRCAVRVTSPFVADLADYLDLTVGHASEQFSALLHRRAVAPGERQVAFTSVETLLCLAASFLINHRHYGGSTVHRAPEPSPPRSGMRRIISPWEYRHLRAFAGVRIGAGIVTAGLGAFILSEVSGAWAIFGAFLLAVSVANFWFASWELSIARSEPART